MTKIVPLSSAVLKKTRRPDPTRFSGTVADVVRAIRPELPLYILQPERVAENVRAFISQFPGTTMFAVKSNPDKTVIQTMVKSGLKAFDCASIDEIRMIRKLAPKAKIYFMHPVKAREAIREAYEVHGVRAFSLDTMDELYKIVHETGYAPDLELFVRIATPSSKGKAILCWARKFGAEQEQAADLLQKCRPVASRLGVAFHVGWQCMDPKQYRKAVQLAGEIIRRSGVKVEALDVGGGFPSAFSNMTPPARQDYMAEITRAVKDAKLADLDLYAEPGQALVSNAGTLVARVELRKGNMLYLNDGVFGCLHDAGKEIGISFPVAAFRDQGKLAAGMDSFQLAGPTCTTEDMMPGPYMLPADIDEGDWIAFSMNGAYAMTFRTNFNGFGACQQALLYDAGESNVAARHDFRPKTVK